MPDISGKYKQIIEDIEKHIKDPEELEFVKEKFSDLSMLFIDMLDRVTKLTDMKIEEIETRQQEITKRINSVQEVVDGIENDIYDTDENYEFEIVCPYCNYEFTADIEDENKEEIECPECHNTIELDWNYEEENSCCPGECSHCQTNMVAEDETEYDEENKKQEDEDDSEDEDM